MAGVAGENQALTSRSGVDDPLIPPGNFCHSFW